MSLVFVILRYRKLVEALHIACIFFLESLDLTNQEKYHLRHFPLSS